jgi:Holliday junction resolvase-like predicted endonuclease
LARNHREKFNEIDIIARRKDGLLIFCEVKTINSEGYPIEFMPEDNLSREKLNKLIRASSLFLARHPWAVYEGSGWQIDFIAIVLKNGKLADLRHYENL